MKEVAKWIAIETQKKPAPRQAKPKKPQKQKTAEVRQDSDTLVLPLQDIPERRPTDSILLQDNDSATLLDRETLGQQVQPSRHDTLTTDTLPQY